MLRSFAPTSLLSIAMVSLQSNRRAYVRVGSHRLWIYSSSRFSHASRSTRSFSSSSDQDGGSRRKTVDEQEVSKFGAIGSAWWDLNGMQKPLHSFNALRATFLRNMTNEQLKRRADHLEGLKVLDVGCGGGILSEELCRMGGDVTGIDASPQNIEVAEQHAGSLLLREGGGEEGKGGSLRYLAQTTTQLLQEGGEGAYDVVVCSEVLEHVSDVEHMVGELCRLVAPHGLLVISTINKTTLSYALGVVAAEQVLGLVPRGTHDWDKFIDPEELRRMLHASGFRVPRLIGAGYNPLLDQWFVTPDKSVNYLLYAARTT